MISLLGFFLEPRVAVVVAGTVPSLVPVSLSATGTGTGRETGTGTPPYTKETHISEEESLNM